MTIEEFQKLMVGQQKVIKDCLEEAKKECQGTTNIIENELAHRKMMLFDMKLDLMDWIVKKANEIEVPKTKMREFL